MLRHNKLCNVVADLSRKPFTPSHVRNDLLIIADFSIKTLQANLARTTGTTLPENVPHLEAT